MRFEPAWRHTVRCPSSPLHPNALEVSCRKRAKRVRSPAHAAASFIAGEGARRIAGLARLRGQTDLRVGGAKSAIAIASFDDFEEETLIKGLRVKLKILPLTFALIKDIMRLEAFDVGHRQVTPGLEVVVVVFGYGQDRHAVRRKLPGALEDVVCRECNMLDAGAERLGKETGRLRARRL